MPAWQKTHSIVVYTPNKTCSIIPVDSFFRRLSRTNTHNIVSDSHHMRHQYLTMAVVWLKILTIYWLQTTAVYPRAYSVMEGDTMKGSVGSSVFMFMCVSCVTQNKHQSRIKWVLQNDLLGLICFSHNWKLHGTQHLWSLICYVCYPRLILFLGQNLPPGLAVILTENFFFYYLNWVPFGGLYSCPKQSDLNDLF